MQRVDLDPAAQAADPGVLAGVRPLLGETARFIGEEFRDPSGAPPVIREESIGGIRQPVELSWPRSVQTAFNRFVTASAGLVVQEADDAEEEKAAFVDGLLETRLGTTYKDQDFAFLPGRILETAERVERLQALADKAHEAVTAVADGPEQRLELLKLLGEQPRSPQRADTDVQALQLLDTFTAHQDESAAFAPALKEELEAGGFDELIGRETLREAAAGSPEFDERVRAEADKLIRLAGRLAGENDTEAAIAALATPDNIELWPAILKKALDARKAGYAHDLDATRSRQTELLSVFRAMPPAGAGEQVEQLADDLILRVAEVRSKDQTLPVHKRMGARATVSQMKRRNRKPASRRQNGASANNGHASDAESDASPKPRTLTYIQADGSETPETAADSDEPFGGALAKQLQSEDVKALSRFLRDLDLSSGSARGIGPYRFGSDKRRKRNDRRLPPAHVLNPNDAVGLSLSPQAGDIRVIFMLEDDTVKILGPEQGDHPATHLERKAAAYRDHKADLEKTA